MPIAMAGTEVYTHTLATMQKSSGHEVAVVTPHIEHYRKGPVNEHYLYNGIDVYQFLETGDPTDRQVHYGNKKPGGLENFKQLIVDLNPGIIHFHELNRSIGFTIEHVKIAKQYGAKVILTMHLSSYTCNTNILVRDGKICDGKIRERTCSVCTYKTLFHIPSVLSGTLGTVGMLSSGAGITDKLKNGKVKTLMMVPQTIKRIKNELKELIDNLDQFVSYARWYERILIENGVPQNKITVVPAALVTVKKKEIKKAAISTGLPVKMVFVGRIQQTKGIHLVIKALQQFSAKEVYIDIYGREEETSYYRKCIKDSIGMETINWKGALKREQVLDCLIQYDIFCLASTFSEMSPLVIQEAFAAGIPVMASKVYGNMEQVKDHYNGILFEFNSSESLQEKIQYLVNNPGAIHQMKNNVVAPVDFDVVNEMYLSLYASL
jgi:glycosyltransferase involved in cell wall biosynthesis